MESPRDCSFSLADWFSLEVLEDLEEQHDITLGVTSLDVLERNEDEGIQSTPDQGAAAKIEEGEEGKQELGRGEEGEGEQELGSGEGEQELGGGEGEQELGREGEQELGEGERGEDLGGEGCFGAGALAPLDDRNREGGGASGGGGENLEVCIREGTRNRPADRLRAGYRARFNRLQLQELENVFKRTQYPKVQVRRELAGRLGVTEDRVQVWFKNRRVKWRRQQRAPRIRNVAPMCPGHPVTVLAYGPYYNMFVLSPFGTWNPLGPLPFWLFNLPPPPMPPMPPMPPPFPPHFLMPPPWLLPPLPPYGMAPCNLIQFLMANNPYAAPMY